MRLSRPSPAMVVALVALVVAMSGTAVAAVTYADRAGSVDGKSAVSASASLDRAAGRLVATQRGGPGKGRIPGKFVDDVMRGGSSPLSLFLRSTDNQAGRPTALAIVPGIGRFDAACNDVQPAAGTQATQTTVTFTPSFKDGVSVSRLLGSDVAAGRNGSVLLAARGQPVPVLTRGDSLFQVLVEAKGRTVFVNGATRTQDNPGPSPACVLWGIALRVS